MRDAGATRAATAWRWAAGAFVPAALVLYGVLGGIIDPVRLLGAQGDTHGAVKGLLLVWQTVVLLRGPQLALAFALALPTGVACAVARGRPARAAAAIALFAGVLLAWRAPGPPWPYALALALTVANVWPWRLPRWTSWVPGVALALPLPVARTVLTPEPPAGGAASARSAVVLAMLPVMVGAGIVGGALLDARLRFAPYEQEALTPWPEGRADPRVERVATSPRGLHSDFHDLELVRDRDGSLRAVVTAESQRALLAYGKVGSHVALLGSTPLPAWWGPMEGLVMDAETDPRGTGGGGLTWTLDGPHAVVARRWTGSTWEEAARSVTLPRYVHHAYTVRVDGSERADGVYLFAIGLSHQSEGTWVMRLTDNLDHVAIEDLAGPEGHMVRGIRDVAWVPPIGAFVLVPDMGEQLWIWTPGSRVATPWLRVSTRNGKPVWVPELGELLLPAPERGTVWRIDPVAKRVSGFSTQPGVRAVGVDARRGRLWSASVLTGAVVVQDLRTGAVLDHYAGLMPMFRTLAVDPATGDAWVAGWRDLWRIPGDSVAAGD